MILPQREYGSKAKRLTSSEKLIIDEWRTRQDSNLKPSDP